MALERSWGSAVCVLARPPEVSAAEWALRSGCRCGRLRGSDGGGRWGPGPAGRERRAAVRAAGPGAGSGKRGPEVGGKRAGLAAHPSQPASAGWELGGGWGAPCCLSCLISALGLSCCVVENR